MTLPFKRRHHDDEAWHDRARALFSAELLGPLDPADQAWLDRHLERCPDCRADREGYASDHALLRGLRDRPPLPPRDLWARTAAELERQNPANRARRSPLGLSLRPVASRSLPYGPLAGALVVLVVLVVALMPPGGIPLPSQIPPGSPVAVGSRVPGATPIQIAAADEVGWITSTADGHYSIQFAAINEVCGDQSEGCAALAAGSPAPLELGAPPQAVVLSPSTSQLQVAVVGAAGETAGSVIILDVPTPRPTGSAAPTATPGMTSTTLPTETPTGTSLASATPIPTSGSQAIITGVVVVGDVGYSDDGLWFAFSARPLAGTGGPDLYAWHVGDAVATRLTDNGATFFSGWFGNRIVASGIVPPAVGDSASPSPSADASPGAHEASAAPATLPSPDQAPTQAPPLEVHPYSFLLDPVTGDRAVFAQPDVWLPVIDRTGRFVVYWSGTITPADAASASESPAASASESPAASADGSAAPSSGSSNGLSPDQVSAWRPANGRMVLDGWSSPIVVPEPSPEGVGADTSGQPASPAATAPISSAGPTAATTATPTEAPGASGQLGSPVPSQPVVAEGPAGTQVTLADAPLSDFLARFDPDGTRLAIWTADPDNATIGPLWLVVLDPALGVVSPVAQPLQAPGVIALRGFSLKDGRLGWVTPEGQDGQPSSVHVLGWSGDAFGQVETVPGGNPQIVR